MVVFHQMQKPDNMKSALYIIYHLDLLHNRRNVLCMH